MAAPEGTFHPVLPPQGQRRKYESQVRRLVLAVASALALLTVLALCSSTSSSRSLTQKSADETTAATTQVLSGSERKGVQVEVKSLESQIKAERKEASQLDALAAHAESKFKTKLLVAKKDEAKGGKDSQHANQMLARANAAEKKAGELLTESKKAKASFLASEQPIEKAGKLASHDKSAYRKAELKVAQLVTKLSEHPGDSKLSKEVASLVSKAKKERKMMESDHKLLTEIQQKTAGLHVGGAKGWAQLKDRSVSLERKAKDFKVEAKSLQSQGSDLKEQGNEILKEVQVGMVKPDQLHAKAKADRTKYAHQLKTVAHLKQELLQPRSSSGGSTALPSLASKAKPEAKHLQMEDHSSGDGRKKPQVLSTKQSTFLSGLWSNSSPWDKGVDKLKS